MTIIAMVELDHDQITEKVRIELARRLTGLLDRFEVFLEDDPREFSPGQITNYLNAVKLLASLYQAHQRPVDKSGMVSAAQVEKLIEIACAQAVAEALEAEKARTAHERALALESAGTGIRDALNRERERQSRAS
jgi:nitrogen-specific signal transduction histidine kinase